MTCKSCHADHGWSFVGKDKGGSWYMCKRCAQWHRG